MDHKLSRRFLIIFAVLVILSVAFKSMNPANAASAKGDNSSAKNPSNLDLSSMGIKSTQELLFYNGDLKLSGELILPEGEDPFPAVVMIHGSAPDTREIFYKTGDAFAFLDAGIAVFIYDKRGTGDSDGDGFSASLEDLADDAIAAVRIVKQHPEIKSEAVGVFGVSQGGTLGPLAASRSADMDFVINVTGSATTLANQEMWGTGNELARRGFSSKEISLAMKGFHLLYSARPLIQRGILPLDYLWFDSKDPYLDPADYWPQVEQPLFVAYGALDSVVPTTTSVEIAFPVLRNGHPYNRLHVYADAGHGIRRESGNWSDGHIEAMTAWTLAVASGKEPPSQPEISSAGIDSGVNRWYGLGNKETPWYGSAPIQLLLIMFFTIVFLFAFVVSLVPSAGLQNMKYGHIPRIVLGLSGLLNLSILVSFLMVLNFLLNADAEGYFPPVPMIGWLNFAPIVSIALTIVLLFMAQKGRRGAEWSDRVKGFYNLITLTSVGFMLFMGYWGLIFN